MVFIYKAAVRPGFVRHMMQYLASLTTDMTTTKSTIRASYKQHCSSYLKDNTLHLRSKDQAIKAVKGNITAVFYWESYANLMVKESAPYNRPRGPKWGVQVKPYFFFNLGVRKRCVVKGTLLQLYHRGTDRYTLYRSLGGPHGRSGRLQKISNAPEFKYPAVKTVESSYTDWVIPVR